MIDENEETGVPWMTGGNENAVGALMVDEIEECGVKDFGPIPWEWEVYFEQIADAGLDYQRFSPYHFRIELAVDFWPTRGKWYVPFLGDTHPHLYEKGVGVETLISTVRKIEAARRC